MSVRDKNGMNAMRRLIERLPEAAKVVMDHSLIKSTDNPDDPKLKVGISHTVQLLKMMLKVGSCYSLSLFEIIK